MGLGLRGRRGLGRDGLVRRGSGADRLLGRRRFGCLLGVRRRGFGGGRFGLRCGERVAHRLRDRAFDVRLGAARVGAELTQLGQDALARYSQTFGQRMNSDSLRQLIGIL